MALLMGRRPRWCRGGRSARTRRRLAVAVSAALVVISLLCCFLFLGSGRIGSSGGGTSAVASDSRNMMTEPAPPAAAAARAHSGDQVNKQEEVAAASVGYAVGRRRLLSGGPGSHPPRCTSKCGSCSPCYPVHVSVPPGVLVTTEYYPEAWRCKCRNQLYMP